MTLRSFRGGAVHGWAPDEFAEDEWAELYGVVLEPDGTLRSQWSSHWMAPAASDLAVNDELLLWRQAGDEPWQSGGLPADTDPTPELRSRTWEESVLFWDEDDWDEKLWALGGEVAPV